MTSTEDMNSWNRQVIDEFRANGGKVGGRFEGAPMILVHHVGARTGTERVNPMVYFPDGDRLLVVASKGGAPTNPDWYHNLKAHPQTDVEVGTERFPVEVAELGEDERSGSPRPVPDSPNTSATPTASSRCSR